MGHSIVFATFPPDVPHVSFQDDVPNLKVK